MAGGVKVGDIHHEEYECCLVHTLALLESIDPIEGLKEGIEGRKGAKILVEMQEKGTCSQTTMFTRLRAGILLGLQFSMQYSPYIIDTSNTMTMKLNTRCHLMTTEV